MTSYDLDRLGHEEFEHLIQALLKKIIGAGTITFGDGPDGGREATYSGKAPYPSSGEQWKGKWIFQAKFHDTRQVGSNKARREVLKDLKDELEKITIRHKLKCNNYILATNVRLSSTRDLGTHDKIAQKVAPEFLKIIPHIHVWGYDDLCRFLDVHVDIRQTYLHLITPGDLIAELMDLKESTKSALAEVIHLYVCTSFEREQNAQLDQAGEIGERPMPLRRVFVDLGVKPRSEKDASVFAETAPAALAYFDHLGPEESFPAAKMLISSDVTRIVLIGGPGQGKSTLGQFIAQIHRACIQHRIQEINGDRQNYTPTVVRVPFRVSLSEYAQWMVNAKGTRALEKFLAHLVGERSGREISSEQIQKILKENPSLLVLDGLDEVTDRELRTEMLKLLLEFIGRCEDVLKANLQIVATSRPTGYSDQFDPSRFLHLTLVRMDSKRVLEYTEKWIEAKKLDSVKGSFLRLSILDCLEDPHFSLLMNTPLQVTIFILIVLSGGTPPRQREELFNEYLEVIYKRERAKSKTIIQTEKRLLFGLHQYLGYILHRRAADSSDTRSRMKEEDFAKEVFRYLNHNDPYSDQNGLKRKADQMIIEAHERLVLVVEIESGFFGFELRSIQEFFAAGYLADTASDNKQRFERFQAVAIPPHWRNVALFFAGRVGRCYPGEAAHILEVCREIDRQKPDYFTKRGAWLALEIAVDRSFGPNRMLQRSAVEYALTLLDGVLDREKRTSFASYLRQLPKEDFQHHVEPLLGQRLQKAHLPEGFCTIEVFHALSKDSSPIEKVVTSALEQRTVTPDTLLEKALEYQLSPQYIKSGFADTLANLSDDEAIDLLFPYFVIDPQYIAKVLRNTRILGRVAVPVFNASLYYLPRTPAPAGIMIPFPVSYELIDQIELSCELVGFLRYVHDRFEPRGYQGYLEQRRSWYSEYYWTDRFYTAKPDLGRKMKDLARIAVGTSSIIELRAAALALLFGFFLPHGSQVQSDEIVRQFFPLSLKDNKQIETTDSILFWTRSPSLQMIRSMTKENDSIGPTRNTYNPFVEARLPKEVKEFAVHVVILDPLNTEQFGEIMEAAWNKKKPPKKFSMDLFRIRVRIAGTIGAFGLRTTHLSAEFVAKTLSVIARLIQQNGPQVWRAWAVIPRLTSFEWGGRSPSSSRGRRELENAIALLREAFEQAIDSLPGRWEIAGILGRSATINGLEHHLKGLLDILCRMPEGRLCDRKTRFCSGSFNRSVPERLLRIAMKSGDVTFRGFLKWFALLIEGQQNLYPRSKSNVSRVKFDTERVKAILKGARGLTRQGALFLLAQSRSISCEEVSQLLGLSKSDRKPIDRAWAELVKGAVKYLNTREATPFLESVLSMSGKYPKAVKYAALEKYQLIARSVTIDIKKQERSLGLPFPDINHK